MGNENNPALAWPEVRRGVKPWTRWWWHGSAVDKKNLSRLIEEYHRVGLGGMELDCIYGVKGWEDRAIDFMSKRWLEMVEYSIQEAAKHGMGFDLDPVNGWRFGGPFVTKELGASRLRIWTFELKGGERIEKRFDVQEVLGVSGTSGSGKSILLNQRVSDGKLKWKAPAGKWTVYVACSVPRNEGVKRAGPGGRGRTINPFSRKSFELWAEYYTPKLKGLQFGSLFHDSWEYATDTCPGMFEEFKDLRGYDLCEYLPALAGRGDKDTVERVRHDVRKTLSDMALKNFMRPWTRWCHSLGTLSRNQAHGSPGNVLDLYAASDIPETEVFRQPNADTPLISKLASSAAHVTGKGLVTSETCTWLDEHFHVSLAEARQLIEILFVSGINRIYYHGTAYSPESADWPGWVFYASYQFNPQNPVWRDFPALNSYVTRCQSVLQAGKPDNEVLLYFPFHEIFQKAGGGFARKLDIKGDWMRDRPVGKAARLLWRGGYGFDYVSDRQLADAEISGGDVKMPGGSYEVILVPRCELMPPETLAKLDKLARKGAKVAFLGSLPEDVPGLADLKRRRARLGEITGEWKLGRESKNVSTCDLGKGVIHVAGNVEAAMKACRVKGEPLVKELGLMMIRLRHESGRFYFIVNHGNRGIDRWVRLAAPCGSASIMDPATGRAAMAAVKKTGRGGPLVYLQIPPGKSCILRTFEGKKVEGPPWPYIRPADGAFPLKGTWKVKFIAGGPELPEAYETRNPASWADRGGDYERFAGTARYRLTFDRPSNAESWLLDLGAVYFSASVSVNGRSLGTLIGPTFTIRLGKLKPKNNILEVEVTSLAANRIRDLDKRGVKWRIFHDINFVNIHYSGFDASKWKVQKAGLEGPVRLVPLEKFNPGSRKGASR